MNVQSEMPSSNGLAVFCRQVADIANVGFDPFSILMTLIPAFLACINDNDNVDPAEVAAWVRMKNRADRHRLLKRFTKNAITKSKKEHRKNADVRVLTEKEAHDLAVSTVDVAVSWEPARLNNTATACCQSA